MKYLAVSPKSVKEVVSSLIQHAEDKEFEVTNVYDVNSALHAKGMSFPNECVVLDISNPHRVLNLLSTSMDMSMLLPCKVSVYRENDETKISMIRQKQLYRDFTDRLDEISDELEHELIEIIETSK